MPYGVSNSFKRGTVKTYSRQRSQRVECEDGGRPHKRIRMDSDGTATEHVLNRHVLQPNVPPKTIETDLPRALVSTKEQPSSSDTEPSSPVQEGSAIFSSDPIQDVESPLSSPPSSPPEPARSPVPTSRKPAFSYLKRKSLAPNARSESRPLSEITSNSRKVPPLEAAQKPVTQTRIDLGGEVRKTCRMCGMEYVPSAREDMALHKKFCGMNAGGVDLGKAFLRDGTLKRVISVKADKRAREGVYLIERRSSLALKTKARAILEVVNAELAAADISDETLWKPLKRVSQEPASPRKKKSSEKNEHQADRYKAFLYLVEDRCVGFCLAEKISQAFPVLFPERTDGPDITLTQCDSSSISVSRNAQLALLGISRIWVSKTFRCQGVALDLLRCAQDNFYYGIQIPKNLIAFSQPTESGCHLAERWFGAKAGWPVYRGER